MYESLDLIILAIIAGFIIYKLYSILGYGDEKSFHSNGNKKIVDIFPVDMLDIEEEQPTKALENIVLKKEVHKIIDQIKAKDKSFNIDYFLQGAIKAFEMILKAYSEEDKALLKKLLSKQVYKDFINDIENKQKNNLRLDKTIVSIISHDISEANFQKNIATISVTFVSQQINLLRNAQNEIVEGNPAEIDNIKEIWTFSRDITNSDPNWTLTKIQSA